MIAEPIQLFYRMFLTEKGFVSESEMIFDNYKTQQNITVTSTKRNLKAYFDVHRESGCVSVKINQWREYQKIYELGSPEAKEMVPKGKLSWPIW